MLTRTTNHMNNDQIKKIFLIPALTAGFYGCNKTGKPDPAPPNIVFIYADDLGYGDLGCYGSENIYTPHIDHLAENGIRFTDFYATAAVCTPSRAGLLTGRYQVRSGMTHVEASWVNKGLPEEEITLAELLKNQDYATALIGKWHLGHKKGHLPQDAGFDRFFGLLFSNDMNIRSNPSYGHRLKPEDLLALWDDSVKVDQEVYQPTLTQRLTCEASNFIAENRDHPFFLYFAHWAPHEPLHASAQFKGKSKEGLYGDVVQEMDHSVGEIIKTLEKYDLLHNTIIVFSSDNGARVAPQRFGEGEPTGSNGILRSRKTFTFEGGIRVPTIFYWEGRTQRGSVITDPSIMTDWFPTFAAITGAEVPNDRVYDGKDLSSLLFSGESLPDRPFFFYKGDQLQAVRYGKWKYKIPDLPDEKQKNQKDFSWDDFNKTPLLFNLEKDPGETSNLLKQFPEIAERMRSKTDSFELSVKNNEQLQE